MPGKKDGRSKLIVPYTGREKGRREVACASCGQKFVAVRPTRKYCSAYCRHLAVQPKKPAVEKTCESCGSIYMSNQSKRRFCSDRCSHRAYTTKNRAAYNARMRAFNRNMAAQFPWKICLKGAAQRARDRGEIFSLTEAWALARWTGKCEWTGVPFVVGRKTRTWRSPSIDRIDSTKGYTPENSRFILWGLNMVKHEGTDDEVREFFKIVSTRI